MNIAVIGGGWYGCHIALKLRLAGHNVTIFESGDDIFHAVSGKFGIRLHAGPHYPRSAKTRESCRNGLARFISEYRELIVEHAYSIYGLGTIDSDNEPPKIDLKTFREVGSENKNCREIEPKKWGYTNLQSAFDIEEPSILVGDPLRRYWNARLSEAGVNIIRRARIHNLTKIKDKVIVRGDSCSAIFDYVVNATGYQALLPPPEERLPLNLDIIYQPCLALIYVDKLSPVMSLPPFSFIVMDGWFPCIMPWIGGEERDAYRKYIVTHGKYTIMGSFNTPEEAHGCLAKVATAERDEKFVTTQIQEKCEVEMARFWPLFGVCMPGSTERRFQCVGWQGSVLAKIKTNREFRSAVTFEKDGVIYVIPGKVSNIFDAGDEVAALINKQNVLQEGSYRYIRNGILHGAMAEISEEIDPRIRNTCALQTYAELKSTREVYDSEQTPHLLSRSEVSAFFRAPRSIREPLKTDSASYPPQIRASL